MSASDALLSGGLTVAVLVVAGLVLYVVGRLRD